MSHARSAQSEIYIFLRLRRLLVCVCFACRNIKILKAAFKSHWMMQTNITLAIYRFLSFHCTFKL